MRTVRLLAAFLGEPRRGRRTRRHGGEVVHATVVVVVVLVELVLSVVRRVSVGLRNEVWAAERASDQRFQRREGLPKTTRTSSELTKGSLCVCGVCVWAVCVIGMWFLALLALRVL
jgi:hypothetical protein